jgi:hypothetical protein
MIRTLTVLTALIFSGGLFASPLVWDATGNNQLGKLDLSTGAFTLVTDLGFTPAGLGEVGNALFTADGGGSTLYSVNPNNGGVQAIGSLSNLTYYAFGSTTTGLYMVDTVGGLWNINPATGANTFVGSTHLIMDQLSVGLSTGSNILYIALGSNVYTINTTTGLASFIGTSGSTDFGALISVGNTVYGTSVVAPNAIYTFDPSTGMAAFLTNATGDYGFGLAASIIPEPGSLGLLGLGMAGFLLAGYALKRRTA